MPWRSSIPPRRHAARPNRPRSRREIAEEREKLRDDTEREVDAVVAEFHALLPRNQAKAIGAVYARYSSRYQDSIADQVRGCLRCAVQQGIFVPREYVFFDLAVRGAKQRRPGLDQLKEVLARKGVQVLLLFSTNRLARKTYKALQFVEEQVVGRGIRAIFVKAGVDSNDEGRWRTLLNYHAGIDEFVTSMYAENIRAAQEGLFHLKLVFGTITFGFHAKPVPGRSTRQKKERCEYEIDPEVAAWVVKIFRWYVVDCLSIAEIVQRLNSDPAAPLGPKAVNGTWTRVAVRLLLANPRYRGWWRYGNTKTVWQSAADYARQLVRDKPLAQQQFEELRIIDDATWYAAAKRLTEAKERFGGRHPNDGDRRSRPRLLNGMYWCPKHTRALQVGGADGRAMICPVCRDLPPESRTLFSQVNRILALRLTCLKLAELVRADQGLVTEIIEACQQEAAAAQNVDPSQQVSLKKRIDKRNRQIHFILANPGDAEQDRQESARLLRQLRTERATDEAEWVALEKVRKSPKHVPSEAEVLGVLNELGTVLATAASGELPDEIGPVRAIVEMLTGGHIEMEQMGERRAQRGWLRGHFRVHLLDAMLARLSGVTPSIRGPGLDVTIDYRKPDEAERWADRVKKLFDQGKLIKAIGLELGIGRNLAAKALDAWFERNGLSRPDGRSRRAQLAVKHLNPQTFEAMADEVKSLMDQGLLLHEIAAQLGCDRNTVTKAKDLWFTSRGMQPPDGRTRRKDLDRKSGPQ